MAVPAFAELLSRHMRRIRASAGGVAAEIGISREAVNNWRSGASLPSRRHRDRVHTKHFHLGQLPLKIFKSSNP